MTLPFFYEPFIPSIHAQMELGEEASRHCIQVLRMKTGEQMQLTNGLGDLYKARILSEDKKKCVVYIEETIFVPRPHKKISVALSLLKNSSRFEWFLEKATEIGVSDIYPLLCQHTEHTRFRHDRMSQIVQSAMLQSQQAWLPVLHEPIRFRDLIRSSGYTLQLIAHCNEPDKKTLQDIPVVTDVQILIGPEGDFSAEEIQWASEGNFQSVTLGQTRLRSETAGVVAAALLINKR